MGFTPHSLPDLAPAYLPQFELPHTKHRNAPAQEAYRPYSINHSSAFTLQAQLSGGQVATTPNHNLHPSTLPTWQPGYAHYGAVLAGNSQPASASAAPMGPASPMGPPARPRKRKAATLRAEDWEPYKRRILDLHIEQKLPLPKVRQMIEGKYGFKAELRQYRSRISKWGEDKNVKPQEMEAIVRKRQKRKLVETNKGQLVFEVRGNQVEPLKIERWMKRHDVVDSFLYAPSPAASTPSDVGCYTIPERDSPAVISVYSPAASILSPGGMYSTTQSPQMPSPALSVSSIVRPQISEFAGQSPALTYRSLPNLQLDFVYSPSTSESAMDVGAQTRYRADEEERLRNQILIAETTFVSNSSEISDMLFELGEVLIDQGRYRAAEDVACRLVERHESQSGNGDDDVDTLKALNLFGQVLQYQGLYVKAERLFRQALQGREKVLRPEHPYTLRSMHNLASLLDN